MKSIILILAAVLLAGCDQKTTYPPPQYLGNGTFIFEAKDQSGHQIFHESLSLYLKTNPNFRVVSIIGIDVYDGVPRRYLVVGEFIDKQAAPPNPTTLPVNEKGEIQYP